MGEWQPIESAPMDGTPIIGVHFGRYGWLGKCWWQPEFEAFIESCREMSLAHGYAFENGASSKLHSPVIQKVTHWIPLPEQPA